jgi:hypothetical protein
MSHRLAGAGIAAKRAGLTDYSDFLGSLRCTPKAPATSVEFESLFTANRECPPRLRNLTTLQQFMPVLATRNPNPHTVQSVQFERSVTPGLFDRDLQTVR